MIHTIKEIIELIPSTHRWIVAIAIIASLTYYQTNKINTEYADEMRGNLENVVRLVVAQKDNCSE